MVPTALLKILGEQEQNRRPQKVPLSSPDHNRKPDELELRRDSPWLTAMLPRVAEASHAARNVRNHMMFCSQQE